MRKKYHSNQRSGRERTEKAQHRRNTVRSGSESRYHSSRKRNSPPNISSSSTQRTARNTSQAQTSTRSSFKNHLKQHFTKSFGDSSKPQKYSTGRSKYEHSRQFKNHSQPTSQKRRHTKGTSDIVETQLKGVYERYGPGGRKLYTLNLIPGKQVYDETLVQQKGVEYREWNPRKSKLGAAIMKNISQIGIMPGKKVLYLGSSTGTTCSHVSDIVGKNGFVIGVDPAPRVMREFYFLSKERTNMAPLLADAAQPDTYPQKMPSCDVVFQDIAQRGQVSIFLKNCESFLTQKGFGLLSIKARSINVARKPQEIFDEVASELEKSMTIVDYRTLDPYERDHCLFVVKKK